MPLSKDLIEVVACPKCKGELALRADESGFECRSCNLLYAIVDEIPNFIIEEARPL